MTSKENQPALPNEQKIETLPDGTKVYVDPVSGEHLSKTYVFRICYQKNVS